jgi:hypothetical protein
VFNTPSPLPVAQIVALSIITYGTLAMAAIRNWNLIQTQRLEAAADAYTILPIDIERCG